MSPILEVCSQKRRYQSTNIANAFGAIGYLAAIAAQISMCIRPRAVFIEGAIVDAVGTCLAVSMSLLASWCVVKAREHTSAPGHLSDYNSSACVVSAIWLMFNVWSASECINPSNLPQQHWN